MPSLLDEIRASLSGLSDLRDRDRTMQQELEQLLARIDLRSLNHPQHSAVLRAQQAAEDAAVARAGAEKAHRELQTALLALASALPQLPDSTPLNDLPPVEDVFRPALSTVKVRALPKPGGDDEK